MGVGCSKTASCCIADPLDSNDECVDVELKELIEASQQSDVTFVEGGQSHLLYKKKQRSSSLKTPPPSQSQLPTMPTRLITRTHDDQTHIYAIRHPTQVDEQCPTPNSRSTANPPNVLQESSVNRSNKTTTTTTTTVSPNELFSQRAMVQTPDKKVLSWTTVDDTHNIHVLDVGLTHAQCDALVHTTERVCQGQYAAYTYAKQTLGCREFPPLAAECQAAVHTVVHAILQRHASPTLVLDDREPHMVKYDLTKKERQKLDMHTDKSEWTFLIALSHGCGHDYTGGGTYFEALNATVHVQRGHALVFPGKLRHCGQRITNGLRFLLVGFLVDANNHNKTTTTSSKKT